MAMIKLTGINKIYRTNEIETLALENVNLDVAKGVCQHYGSFRLRQVYLAEYYGAAGRSQQWKD